MTDIERLLALVDELLQLEPVHYNGFSVECVYCGRDGGATEDGPLPALHSPECTWLVLQEAVQEDAAAVRESAVRDAEAMKQALWAKDALLHVAAIAWKDRPVSRPDIAEYALREADAIPYWLLNEDGSLAVEPRPDSDYPADSPYPGEDVMP